MNTERATSENISIMSAYLSIHANGKRLDEFLKQ